MGMVPDQTQIVGSYYVLTKEQLADGIESARPMRWLHRCSTPTAAMHSMRYFGTFFQHVCVWSTETRSKVAMISQALPLEYDPLAPQFREYAVVSKERMQGIYKTIERRIYAYHRHE